MKQMKKMLSLLLALTVVCSLFAMNASAADNLGYKSSYFVARLGNAADKGAVLTPMVGIRETFDEQPPQVGSNKYFGSTTYTFGNFTSAVVEDGVLKMTPTDGSASRYYWNATTGYINVDSDPHWEESVVSFSFMMPELGYVEEAYRAKFSKTLNSAAQECGPFLMINNDVDGNSANYYIYNATNKADRMKVEANQWYQVTLHMNKQTKTFDWFVNGRKIADDSWFANIGVANSEAVINGGLQTHHFYSNKGTIYYDDFLTYKTVPGQTVYFAEEFTGMAGRTVGSSESWYDGTNTTLSSISGAVFQTEADGNAVYVSSPSATVNPASARLGAWATDANGWANTVGSKETLSYRFKFTDTKHYSILTQIRNGGTHPGFELWLNGTDLYFGRGGVVARTLLKSNMQPNTWYNVILAADMSDINAADQTGGSCAVYLAEDGGDYVCLGKDLKFNWIKGNNTDNGNKIARPFQNEIYYVDNASCTVTYDDIVIYNDIREDIFKAAAESLAASEAALGGTNATVAKPETQNGYNLTWSTNGAVLEGNDTVTFIETEAAKAYTVTVGDADNKLSDTRIFTVNVPKMYETAINAAAGAASATVAMNVNDANANGYANGLAVLAVYDNATNALAEIDLEPVTNGTATLATDAVTTAGEYTAKLFLWVDGALTPVLDNVATTGFTVAE